MNKYVRLELFSFKHLPYKKNQSISLKYHRGNSLPGCCLNISPSSEWYQNICLLLLLLLLDTFKDLVNTVAILGRTFLDMEVLEPIFCAASLVGIIDGDTTQYFTRFFGIHVACPTDYLLQTDNV